MQKEVAAASRLDRSRKKESGTIRGVLQGEAEDTVQDNNSGIVMVKWIKIIRNLFATSVIRRTVNSVDANGNRISGLPPFLEHHLVLELYPAEIENIDAAAAKIVAKETGFGGGIAARKVTVDEYSCGLFPDTAC